MSDKVTKNTAHKIGVIAENIGVVNVQLEKNKVIPKIISAKAPHINITQVIGRQKELEDIYKHLTSIKRALLLNGMGGLGKTTLAQAYLTQYWSYYNHVIWVESSNKGLKYDIISDSILLQNLSIKTEQNEIDFIFSQVMNILRQTQATPGLLIIDNASKSLNKYYDFLPTHSEWHILVTSRELIKNFEVMKLDFLSTKDSVELFLTHYKRGKLDKSEIKDIIKSVDNHTLTIEILAKTAQRHRTAFEQLKNALQDNLTTRVNISHNSTNKRLQNITSYLCSIFDAQQLDDCTIWLLKQFVCLPSELLTFGLLKELLTGAIDSSNLSDKLEGLVEDGWLLYNKMTDSYKMHQIINSVLLKLLNISPQDIENLAISITNKLELNKFKANYIECLQWDIYGESILGIFSKNENIIKFKLRRNLALVKRELGSYVQAKLLIKENIRQIEKADENQDLLAESYYNIAILYHILSKYKQSTFYFIKAIELNEAIYGKLSLEAAYCYSDYGLLLRTLGRPTLAKLYLDKALVIDKLILGDNHSSTAMSYSNLAQIYQDLRDFNKAKELLEKSLEIDEMNYGETHPLVATRYSNLSLVLLDLKQPNDAELLMKKAIHSDKTTFGAEHPSLAIRYLNMSTIYLNLEQYPLAQSYVEDSITLNENFLGVKHPDTGLGYLNLAQVYYKLETFKPAEKYAKKAERIFGDTLPKTHNYNASVKKLLSKLKR
ncbi:tetratricopeptide repeat protein [Aliikangiella sp. IMCC44359]|uniref:tetratricopeptide repeat protein n=1 Tax=Aliikangiella sp. IMCC44359 TaxID=3459125 RepID=UPI00403AE28F